jgi:hypothetical protein
MILNLDYDHCSQDFMAREIFSLKRFHVPLEVWQTSEGSYHIRSHGEIPDHLAWAIMAASRCSEDYKTFCKEYGRMSFRLSEKVEFDGKGRETLIPAPQKLFVI